MTYKQEAARYCLAFLLAFVVSGSFCFAEKTPVARKPNIIFVLADDLGWSELGCYGNTFHETPHLDRLAQQGMRFTQAYAAAPVCSPYRAALLTGQHPARVGILDYLRPNSSNALPTSHLTLPETLQRNGYATGMIGKWHLTGYRYHDAEFEIVPRDHGFAWDIGREVKGVGNGANFWPYVFRDQGIRWLDLPENRLGESEYLTDRLNLEAVDFVKRHKDEPFFLYLSHFAPHTILNGRKDLVDKYRAKHEPGACTRQNCYLCKDAGLTGDADHHWAGSHNPHLAAMLESIDQGIGLLTHALDDLGIAGDTIFVFTSDNGGETNVTTNAPLRGGKSQLYEGGIRVPMIVRWPGHVPANSVCNQPTVNYDFYPTLLDAASIPTDPVQQLDGVSTFSTWVDPAEATDRDAIFWHYPLDQPHFLGGVSAGAVRAGDWKLVEKFDDRSDSRFELYNLNEDISESLNLAARYPERVSELKHRLSQWRKAVGARTPSAPMLVSPRNLYFGDHFSNDLVSNRWFFQKHWTVKDGSLRRNGFAGKNQRIFIKEPLYRNCMIRFDFRFDGATDLRLVTGASGFYNAVVHIRPDHFYIQTAIDHRGPYFSRRHGECAFDFQAGTWHTMTVEIIDDQLVAHVDNEHLAYARHPILDQERTYLAFQVDTPSAAFDNLQIFKAARQRDQADNLARVRKYSNRYPVEKTLQEHYSIEKTNAHDRLYQSDKTYRELVKQVDDCKKSERQAYPGVFASVKEFRKKIDAERRRLHAEDADYKEILFAVYRANRAIDDYLIATDPNFERFSANQKPAAIERLRQKHQNDAGFKQLLKIQKTAQQRLEFEYPQLFAANSEILEQKKQRREAVSDEPEFRKLISATAEAWRTQQAYLHSHDAILARVFEKLNDARN